MKTLAAVIICVVTIVVVLNCFYSPAVRLTKEQKTLTLIKRSYLILTRNDLGLTNGMESLALAESSGYNLSSALNVIRSNPNIQIQELLTNWPERFSPLVDNWHEPMLVYWKSNLIEKASAELLQTDNRLLIWSKGKNKSNEWGYGDDVFLRQD